MSILMISTNESFFVRNRWRLLHLHATKKDKHLRAKEDNDWKFLRPMNFKNIFLYVVEIGFDVAKKFTKIFFFQHFIFHLGSY